MNIVNFGNAEIILNYDSKIGPKSKIVVKLSPVSPEPVNKKNDP